jgi:RHS repeat-associated protein
MAATDKSGALISVNAFDQFGIPNVANTGRFQYTGQVWIPGAAVYHFRARAYTAGIGRFNQIDPRGFAGGDLNLYAYASNDPLNRIDPSGTTSCSRRAIDDQAPIRPDEEEAIVVCGRRPIPPSFDGWIFDYGIEDEFPGGEASWTNIQDQVTLNRQCHEIAVAVEGLRWIQAGFIATPNVSFRDPANGNRRVVADLVISRPTFPPEPFLIIDVKTGEGGLTPNQQQTYPLFGSSGYVIPVGWNALRAGFIPGVRVQTGPLNLSIPRYGSGSQEDCARLLSGG